jgi:ABC-type branched-subunit amino acid transport system substrate-binding protein
MRVRRVALTVVSVLMLGAAGCSSTPSAGNGGQAAGEGIRLYGVDGNMTSSFSGEFKDPHVLSGMAGTSPLPRLSQAFLERLKARNPKLADFNYVGESYDAVIIAGLAAQLARTTEAQAIARYVVGVTEQSPTGQQCTTAAACLALIQQGTDIAYRGISVHSAFTDGGEPSSATYGTLHFGRNFKIDDGKTQYVGAGDPNGASKDTGPAPATGSVNSGPLKLGILLPRTGPLAFQGPPMFLGAELAVADLNAAGGILGHKVEAIEADDGTSADKAKAQMLKFAAKGVSVVIGPSTSGASVAVVPEAVAKGMMVFSPSATSDQLTKLDDNGMFFRTAPPDVYQAHALSDIIMRGGAEKVFIVARDDPYGSGLMKNTQQDLTDSGLSAGNIRTVTYTDEQTDFRSIANAVKDFAPDSVVLIGYSESAKVIEAIAAETAIRTAA